MVLWGTPKELVILQVLTHALEDQRKRMVSDGATPAVVTCEVMVTHSRCSGRPETDRPIQAQAERRQAGLTGEAVVIKNHKILWTPRRKRHVG